jgi:hypothetical protein
MSLLTDHTFVSIKVRKINSTLTFYFLKFIIFTKQNKTKSKYQKTAKSLYRISVPVLT